MNSDSYLRCFACGANNLPGSVYCANCGSRLTAPPTESFSTLHDDSSMSAAVSGAAGTVAIPSAPLAGAGTTSTSDVLASRVYASFGRRLGALLIDSAIVLPIALLIGLGLFTGLTADVVTWLIVSCYFWIGNSYGATPAKRLLSIRVVDANGAAPGLPRGFVRALLPNWLGGVLFVFGTAVPPVLVIVIIQAYDPFRYFRDHDRQTLHDEMAGTWVVRM